MKNKNILGLASTHTIKPILIAGLILCVVQFGCAVMSDQTSLHMIIDNPFIKYTFLGVFVFVIVICGETVKISLSKITLNRLGISKKRMFYDITLNSAMSFVIIWGFQVLSLMLISVYFVKTSQSQLINPQTIYLASFRSEFFHLILPMGDFGSWFCLLSLLFMNSVLSANYVQSLKKDIMILASMSLTFVYFGAVLNNFSGIIFLLIGVYQLCKGVTQNEENY